MPAVEHLTAAEIIRLLDLKPHPEVPNVPWAPDLAKSEEAKKMIFGNMIL
mgnify:CR=1 FL=1